MKHLTGLFFCLICSFPAFSINEQLEYKVQNKSMYFYFSADTLFLEILAIDKPIRYTVDTFFRMKSDSNSFCNEKKIVQLEFTGQKYFYLIIKENTIGGEVKYKAQSVSIEEKTKWNRLYNNIIIGRYYRKVEVVKQRSNSSDSYKNKWNKIHLSLQELDQNAEKFNRQEFEEQIRAVLKENDCLECLFLYE